MLVWRAVFAYGAGLSQLRGCYYLNVIWLERVVNADSGHCLDIFQVSIVNPVFSMRNDALIMLCKKMATSPQAVPVGAMNESTIQRNLIALVLSTIQMMGHMLSSAFKCKGPSNLFRCTPTAYRHARVLVNKLLFGHLQIAAADLLSKLRL